MRHVGGHFAGGVAILLVVQAVNMTQGVSKGVQQVPTLETVACILSLMIKGLHFLYTNELNISATVCDSSEHITLWFNG